jgi:hypothetical protein
MLLGAKVKFYVLRLVHTIAKVSLLYVPLVSGDIITLSAARQRR